MGQDDPQDFMSALQGQRNSLVGLGLGLMSHPGMASALQGYESGARTDSADNYRRAQARQHQQELAFRQQESGRAQSNADRAFNNTPFTQVARDLGLKPGSEEWLTAARQYHMPKVEGQDEIITNPQDEKQYWRNKRTNELRPVEYPGAAPPRGGAVGVAPGIAPPGPAASPVSGILPPGTAGMLPSQRKTYNDALLRQAAQQGATKALPAELAARTAMAGKFLDEAPIIQENIQKGHGTFPNYVNDTVMGGALGSGAGAETVRKLKSGSDALLRNLTGAGMPDAEAKKYIERYEPTWKDTPQTLSAKASQLQDELSRIEESAYRGRGGIPKDVTEKRQVVKDAMDAVKRGAPRDQVLQRLRDQYGINFMGGK